MMARTTTRRALIMTGVTALALAATGCGSGGRTPQGGGSGGGALIWALTGGTQTTIESSVKAWNSANADSTLNVQFFQNDPYKQKLRTAVGAGNGPVLFENWGGGGLKDYVDAGKVADLTPELAKDAAWKDRFFPSVLQAATVDGKNYGLPLNGVQPVVLYYNKDLFAKIGAQPPKTWDDLMALVKRFKDAGIAPIAMGGASKWPDLMWLEYLTDRIGGPGVFEAIAAGKPGAWSDPAVLKAATMIRQLVDAGGFAKGFESVTADTNQPEAQLYTGKAAMDLMGSWAYPVMLTNAPAFVKGGKLGWATFPAVAGGQGDPSNIVGNPANFYSLSAQASDKDKQAAIAYLKKGMLNDSYIDALIKAGEVPPVNGLDGKLTASENADWLGAVYSMTKNAKSFQLSWDQALSPALGAALLTNLDQLFLGQITPEQFCAAMEKAGK
ncbi:extracellular solute-binding protein [Nonomuraea sp. NPDC050153]|uniref:extracellular solute-binding protein n=1 Tax=Nonomuraea sp. NPDC050153 TaxID=3364359 RepID=UPI0037B91F91